MSFFSPNTTVATFLVPAWGIYSTLTQNCRLNPQSGSKNLASGTQESIKNLNNLLTLNPTHPLAHKVRIYKDYYMYSVLYVPSSELGLSQPLSRQGVCPYPQNRGGGGSPAGEGLGESQFRRLEKKLSTLPTLCSSLRKDIRKPKFFFTASLVSLIPILPLKTSSPIREDVSCN